MRTGTRRFFDLAVYRLPEERYYRERETYIEKQLRELRDPIGGEEHLALREGQEIKFYDHLAKRYGGPWEYNEVIGHIQLCFVGTTVSGEYFAVRRERLVRTRKKIIEAPVRKLALDVPVDPQTDLTVLTSIRQYIGSCRRKLPERYINCELFDTIAPHVKWKALYES